MIVESFLKYLDLERNYSDKTITSYRIDLEQFETYLKGIEEDLDVVGADADLVRGWVIYLMDDGYSSSSVNRKLSSLRALYRYLLKKELIRVDPTQKVIAPKKEKPLPVFVKESEMDTLLDEVDFGDDFKGKRDHLIIQMFYSTGMRRAELIGLDDDDVDLNACLIKVTGKRNKQRLIPFGEELKGEIESYLSVRNESMQAATGAFFLGTRGKRITPNVVNNLVKQRLSKVVTLKKKSPHVLRHTFATSMLNHDAELEAVRDLLGHSNLSATEIYTHTTFEMLKKVYKQAHPRA